METRSELDELLEAFDRDRSYTTERLVKENELERTELVRDAAGKRFLRKYITVDADRVHPYERLVGVDCPYLQHVLEARRIGGKLVVVCEYVDGIDLRTFVQRFGVVGRDIALRHVIDLCEALSILHELPSGSVVHRDVSPGNIVISNNKAVLIDLGIARMRNPTASKDTHIWGTSGYAAPEQFGFRQTDARADIYGLGMCLRFMLTGADPDDTKAALPADLARFVERATDMDPQDRFESARQMRDAALMMQGGAVGSASAKNSSVEGWEWKGDSWERAESVPAGSEGVHRAGKENPSQSASAAQERWPLSADGTRKAKNPLEAVEAKITGLTRRSNTVRALWHIYQAITAFTLVLLVMTAVVMVQSNTDLHSKFLYVLAVVCVFLAPGALSINFAYMNDYIPFFERYRHVKILVISIAFVVFAVAVISAFAVAGYQYNPGN